MAGNLTKGPHAPPAGHPRPAARVAGSLGRRTGSRWWSLAAGSSVLGGCRACCGSGADGAYCHRQVRWAPRAAKVGAVR